MVMKARPLKGLTELPGSVRWATPCMRKGGSFKCKLAHRYVFDNCANTSSRKAEYCFLCIDCAYPSNTVKKLFWKRHLPSKINLGFKF